ncbi:MAG TPA: hypothetical protein V6C72_04655, partial [Chroococcales cyanobacterium]
MNKTASDLLIGDLLRGAGLVTLPDLSNAVQVASKTGLPVGRVLVMLGLVTSEVVQAALHAQALIRDRAITGDTGKKALCLVSASRFSLDQALQHMGMSCETRSENKLGDLLLAADLVTPTQLSDALCTSQHLNLPLGRILVLKNILEEVQVQSALEAQLLIRDGRISREQAIQGLRTMHLCDSDFKETISQLGFAEHQQKRHTIRLGELLMLADLVGEKDMLTSVEIGLSESIQLGQVLLEFGFISENTLESALRLQTMVTNNHLSPGQASDALRQVAQCHVSLVQAITDVMEPRLQSEEVLDLLNLLLLAGLITSEDHQRLLMFRDTSIFETVLIGTGLMCETTLEVAICCHMLMSENLLTCEQAIIALHHWRWTGVN